MLPRMSTTSSRPSVPRFGAHVSVAGGLENAFYSGHKVGCDCLQIFVKNQRQWRAPRLTDDQIARYRVAERETGLRPVVAHASYLLNLASPDTGNRSRSISALVDELERCEALGVAGLVLHPGAHLDDTLGAGIRRIARALDTTCRRTPGFATRVLLETTAGQGTTIGHRFEHLATILGRVRDPDRLGVCLDTCHLFAAGYDFRKPEGYGAMIDELADTVGVGAVRCIHMNDSKTPCGSRVDRHEHIGKGRIGGAGFAHFVNDRRVSGVPMILETPKGKDGRGSDFDRVNLKRLRSLVRPAVVRGRCRTESRGVA